ncbi:hypothetical protein GF420_15405 [candidate division GN15 bacterium]|nr:hypothetical protein [candidate division GN15 bacterium]
MRFKVRAFAITCGLLWGLGLFVMTLWVMLWDGSGGDATILAMVYRGYSFTLGGAFVGLIWGLVDGFVGGLIFAWLYNFFAGQGARAA